MSRVANSVLSEVDEMLRSGDWDGAGAKHLVALYERMHERCYGIEAADVQAKKSEAAAAALLKKEFSGDVVGTAEYVLWAFERELGREKWRRENGKEGGRLGVRVVFSNRLLTDYRVHLARNGKHLRLVEAPDDEAPEAAAELEEVDDDCMAGPLEGLPLLSAAGLVGRAAIAHAAGRQVSWLWRSYVCAGQIVLIFGAPGEGKTTLIFLITVARANPEPLEVLGHRVEPAPPGKYVVLIEGEHEAGSAARKLLKTEEILDADGALDRVILLARKEVRIDTPRWEEVKQLIARGLVSDLFVDSLARLASTDANSEQEQVAVFAEIAAALEGAPKDGEPPTCWIIAHGRKNATGGLDDVSGSAQRAAQADTILFVRATKDDDDKVISSRVTAAKLREEPEEWPKAAEFSIAKDDAGRWRCTVGGGSARPQDTPAHERVIAILDTAKTKAEIKAALKLNTERLEKAISVLFAEKRIKKATKFVSGRQRDAFVSKAQTKFQWPSAARKGRSKSKRDAEESDEVES